MYSLKYYSLKIKLTEQVDAWSMNYCFSNFEMSFVGWGGINIKNKFWLYGTIYDDSQTPVTQGQQH